MYEIKEYFNLLNNPLFSTRVILHLFTAQKVVALFAPGKNCYGRKK